MGEIHLRFIGIIGCLLCLTVILGCGKKDIKNMSPKEVITFFHKARNKGDIETLRKIMYFSPATSEEEIEKKIKSMIIGSSEKMVMRMVAGKVKAEYEKIIDDHTAEVGIVLKGGIRRKRIPLQQIILKKNQGIWKYHYYKHEITKDGLIKMIKCDSSNADAYYHLGNKYQVSNPVKANKYFKKYYKLKPNGFWVNKDFLILIKEYENINKVEKKSIAALSNCPKNSPDRIIAYVSLARMFIEAGDITKAKMYLRKTKDVCQLVSSKDPEVIIFHKSKKELESLLAEAEKGKTVPVEGSD